MTIPANLADLVPEGWTLAGALDPPLHIATEADRTSWVSSSGVKPPLNSWIVPIYRIEATVFTTADGLASFHQYAIMWVSAAGERLAVIGTGWLADPEDPYGTFLLDPPGAVIAEEDGEPDTTEPDTTVISTGEGEPSTDFSWAPFWIFGGLLAARGLVR